MGRRFSKLIPYITYDNRSQLKQASGSTGELREVQDLGVFMFVSGLVEPDDDETCFATTSGAWILQSPSVDVIDSIVRPELEEIQNDVTTLQDQIQRVTSEQNGILRQTQTREVVLFDSERDLAQQGTNTNILQLMWRDIGIVDASKIVNIQFVLTNLATTGDTQFYVYPVNEYGATLGGAYAGSAMVYNPNSSGMTGTTSTQTGFWFFPLWSPTPTAGYSYGSGVTGQFTWSPKVYNTYGSSSIYYGWTVSGYIGYQQNTTYQHPNVETIAWDNNSTNAFVERGMGFRIFASAGVFRQGTFTAKITYRP